MKDWNELSTKDKAAFMSIAVRNGVTDMDTIKNIYGSIGDNNVMANGGSVQVQQQPAEQPTQFSLYARLKERRKANRFDYGGPANNAGNAWRDYLESNNHGDDIPLKTGLAPEADQIPHPTIDDVKNGNFDSDSYLNNYNPTSWLDNIKGADGINLSNLSAGKEIKFRPSLGQATQNLGNKLTDKASSLLGGNASGLVNAGLGAAGSIANKGFSKLFSNGLSSGAGNAIGSVGGTIGSLVGAVNPVLGAGISAATGIIGGLTNAAFGSKLNQEHIAAVENSNTMLNNTKISSNDTTSALNDISSINWGADFTKRDIGRDGWFANKAEKKYNELSDAQTLARSRAMSASDTAVSNIAINQRRNAMANFSAYGGPVNKYSLGSDIKQANDDYINAFGRPDWIPLRAVYPMQQQQKEETPVAPQETQQQIPLSDDWNWFVDNIINGNLRKNYGIDTSGWQDRMIHSFDGTAVDYRTSFNNLMGSNRDVVDGIYNTLISKGFTPAQAAGALGNIMVESGFRDINVSDRTKNNPNNIARGYFQMGDLETNNFNKWKQRIALAADTPSHIAQTMYVADMLNGKGGYDYLGSRGVKDLFNSGNPADAATAFMKGYEVPAAAKANENLRRAYADLFYNYYGNQSKYGGKLNKYDDGGSFNDYDIRHVNSGETSTVFNDAGDVTGKYYNGRVWDLIPEQYDENITPAIAANMKTDPLVAMLRGEPAKTLYHPDDILSFYNSHPQYKGDGVKEIYPEFDLLSSASLVKDLYRGVKTLKNIHKLKNMNMTYTGVGSGHGSFVKNIHPSHSQGEPMYVNFANGTWEPSPYNAMWTTDNPMIAEWYAGNGLNFSRDGKVFKIYSPKDADLVEYSDLYHSYDNPIKYSHIPYVRKTMLGEIADKKPGLYSQLNDDWKSVLSNNYLRGNFSDFPEVNFDMLNPKDIELEYLIPRKIIKSYEPYDIKNYSTTNPVLMYLKNGDIAMYRSSREALADLIPKITEGKDGLKINNVFDSLPSGWVDSSGDNLFLPPSNQIIFTRDNGLIRAPYEESLYQTAKRLAGFSGVKTGIDTSKLLINPDRYRKHGGKINRFDKGGIKNSIAKLAHKFSAATMDMFASHTGENPQNLSIWDALLPYFKSEMQYGPEHRDDSDGAAQSTYLLPRWMQEEIMRDYGYIEGEEGDYGPTASTVHNKFGDVPVWQTAPHVIDENRVVPIGMLANPYNPYSPEYARLHNAGSYPTILGIDPVTNTFIGDSYDLNNYGDDGNGDGGAYSKYPIAGKMVTNLLDKVGSPVVVTTGRQPLVDPKTHQMYHYGDNSYLPRDIVEPLDEFFANQNMPQQRLDNSFLYTLPNVTVTPEKKKHGGKINRFDDGGKEPTEYSIYNVPTDELQYYGDDENIQGVDYSGKQYDLVAGNPEANASYMMKDPFFALSLGENPRTLFHPDAVHEYYDKHPYFKGNGIKEVYPEFDLLTLGRSLLSMPKYVGLAKNSGKIFNKPNEYYRQVDKATKAIEDAKKSGVVKVKTSPPKVFSTNSGKKISLSKTFPNPMFEKGHRFYGNWNDADIIIGNKGHNGLDWLYASKRATPIDVDEGGRRIFSYFGDSSKAPSKFFKFYRKYGPAYFDVTNGYMTAPLTGIDYISRLFLNSDRHNKSEKKSKKYGGNLFDDGGDILLDDIVAARENYNQTGNIHGIDEYGDEIRTVPTSEIYGIRQGDNIIGARKDGKNYDIVVANPTVTGVRGSGSKLARLQKQAPQSSDSFDISKTPLFMTIGDMLANNIKLTDEESNKYLYHNPNLGIYKSNNILNPQNNGINFGDVMSFMPVIGDAMFAYDIGDNLYNKNYLDAAIGLGSFVLPPAIAKAAKKFAPKIWNGTRRIFGRSKPNSLAENVDVVPSMNLNQKMITVAGKPTRQNLGIKSKTQEMIDETKARMVFSTSVSQDIEKEYAKKYGLEIPKEMFTNPEKIVDDFDVKFLPSGFNRYGDPVEPGILGVTFGDPIDTSGNFNPVIDIYKGVLSNPENVYNVGIHEGNHGLYMRNPNKTFYKKWKHQNHSGSLEESINKHGYAVPEELAQTLRDAYPVENNLKYVENGSYDYTKGTYIGDSKKINSWADFLELAATNNESRMWFLKKDPNIDFHDFQASDWRKSISSIDNNDIIRINPDGTIYTFHEDLGKETDAFSSYRKKYVEQIRNQIFTAFNEAADKAKNKLHFNTSYMTKSEEEKRAIINEIDIASFKAAKEKANEIAEKTKKAMLTVPAVGAIIAGVGATSSSQLNNDNQTR